jgi:predicted RNA-binding Zn-ribbon protein involved in translation (DUF1610 family)
VRPAEIEADSAKSQKNGRHLEDMSGPNELQVRVYELPCPECGKVSRKSFLQLETEDRLPCDHCGISITR